MLPSLHLVEYGPGLRAEAEALFRRYGRDRRLSWCDAVSVAVTDSASGRITRGGAEVLAFGERPRSSDLLLGTGIRTAGPADTAAEGELGKGNVLIAGGATVLGMSREGMTQFHPRAFETMKEGDILYLAGDNLALAVALLEKGPEALPD